MQKIVTSVLAFAAYLSTCSLELASRQCHSSGVRRSRHVPWDSSQLMCCPVRTRSKVSWHPVQVVSCWSDFTGWVQKAGSWKPELEEDQGETWSRQYRAGQSAAYTACPQLWPQRVSWTREGPGVGSGYLRQFELRVWGQSWWMTEGFGSVCNTTAWR